MITYYQLQKRINDLTHQIIPQDINFTTIHSSKIDVLKWCCLENEQLRTEQEILNRIQRYNEELLAFNDDKNLMYKQTKARIEELNNVIHTP